MITTTDILYPISTTNYNYNEYNLTPPNHNHIDYRKFIDYQEETEEKCINETLNDLKKYFNNKNKLETSQYTEQKNNYDKTIESIDKVLKL